MFKIFENPTFLGTLTVFALCSPVAADAYTGAFGDSPSMSDMNTTSVVLGDGGENGASGNNSVFLGGARDSGYSQDAQYGSGYQQQAASGRSYYSAYSQPNGGYQGYYSQGGNYGNSSYGSQGAYGYNSRQQQYGGYGANQSNYYNPRTGGAQTTNYYYPGENLTQRNSQLDVERPYRLNRNFVSSRVKPPRIDMNKQVVDILSYGDKMREKARSVPIDPQTGQRLTNNSNWLDKIFNPQQ